MVEFKMFHCNICGITYKKHYALVRHEITSNSCRVGILGCTHCPKFFSCQRYLDYHQRNWHYIQFLNQVPSTRRKSLKKLDTNVSAGTEVGEVISVSCSDRKLWYQPQYEEYERIMQISSPYDENCGVSVFVIYRSQYPRDAIKIPRTPDKSTSMLSPSLMRQLSIHDNDGHVFRTIDLRNNKRDSVHVPEFLHRIRSTVNMVLLDALCEHDQFKFNFDLHVEMATIADEGWSDKSLQMFTKSFTTDYERYFRGDDVSTAVGKVGAKLLARSSATIEAGTAICEIRSLLVNVAISEKPPAKRILMDLF